MTAPHGGSGGGGSAEGADYVRLSEVACALMTGEVSEDVSLAGRARLLSALRRRRRYPRVTSVACGSGAIAAGAAVVQLSQPLSTQSAAPQSGVAGNPTAGNGYVSGGPKARPVRFAERLRASSSPRGAAGGSAT